MVAPTAVARHGRRIAFSSDRSGDQDIWLADSDGRNPRRLIDWPESQFGAQWSPDGRHIASYSFGWEGETGTVNPERAGDIYVVSVEGGSVRRLTRDPANDLWPSWSRDGQSIYFASNRGSREEDASLTRLQTWKIAATGGPAVQVTTGGGGDAFESLDGEHLYFRPLTGDRIWSVPVQGGDESPVLNHGLRRLWGLYPKGICYVSGSDPLRPAIECLDLSTRRVEEIVTLDVPLASLSGGRLAVSPDGKWILYGQQDVDRADIMLIETESAEESQ